MNKTYDVGYKLNTPLPVAVYSPFCAQGIWKYREFFTENLFDPLLPISSQIHLLVQKYGWSKLRSAIESVSSRVKTIALTNQFITQVKTIKKGLKMAEHVLIDGHRFLGAPELRGIQPNGSPDICWVQGVKFNFADCALHGSDQWKAFIPEKLNEQFANYNEMIRVFNYFKKTIPVTYMKGGCIDRCIWMNFLMASFFKIDNDNVHVEHAENEYLVLKPPFNPEVKWCWHIAPRVFCLNEGYMFDLGMDEPTPCRTWLRNLHSKSLERSITYFANLEILIRFDTAVTLQRLCSLYLFENVDENMCDRIPKDWLLSS